MKEKIVAKVDEHIKRLLEKPELTNEEYMILKGRLDEIRMAEREAKYELERKAESERLRKSLLGMTSMIGGEDHEQM